MAHRTAEQVKEHYEIEKVIADRLRNSSAAERTELYKASYDELFRRVPHHPLLVVDVARYVGGEGKRGRAPRARVTPRTGRC